MDENEVKMRFCEKEKQPIGNGVTTVDNRFIINYLPDAPDVAAVCETEKRIDKAT